MTALAVVIVAAIAVLGCESHSAEHFARLCRTQGVEMANELPHGRLPVGRVVADGIGGVANARSVGS
jgi:hypothetical protein